MQVEYIYCILEREFINSTENIYKIGKTKQTNIDRFKQYSKGSILMFHMISSNCNEDEREIIQLFKIKYIQITRIGTEYFSGNIHNMIHDMFGIVSQTKTNNNSHMHNKHICELCNFSTNYKWILRNHLESNRHLCMCNKEDNFAYSCKTCTKRYKSRSGLHKHAKTCNVTLNFT